LKVLEASQNESPLVSPSQSTTICFIIEQIPVIQSQLLE